MGDIKKILSKETVDTLPMFHDKIRIEASEAVHFHWRDLRILLSPKQADALFEATSEADLLWDGTLNVDKDVILSNNDIPEDILFENEAKIELLKDGNIHFHWRDLRLELSPYDFMKLSALVEKAVKEYGNE